MDKGKVASILDVPSVLTVHDIVMGGAMYLGPFFVSFFFSLLYFKDRLNSLHITPVGSKAFKVLKCW